MVPRGTHHKGCKTQVFLFNFYSSSLSSRPQTYYLPFFSTKHNFQGPYGGMETIIQNITKNSYPNWFKIRSMGRLHPSFSFPLDSSLHGTECFSKGLKWEKQMFAFIVKSRGTEIPESVVLLDLMLWFHLGSHPHHHKMAASPLSITPSITLALSQENWEVCQSYLNRDQSISQKSQQFGRGSPFQSILPPT